MGICDHRYDGAPYAHAPWQKKIDGGFWHSLMINKNNAATNQQNSVFVSVKLLLPHCQTFTTIIDKS